MNIEKKTEILSKAYTDSQNIISLADSKANISLTIHSLLITIGLGFSLLSNLFEKIDTLIKVILWFDNTDLSKVKDVVGGDYCIAGGILSSSSLVERLKKSKNTWKKQ